MPTGASLPHHYCLWLIPRGDGRDYPAHEALSLHLQRALVSSGRPTTIARRISELRGRTIALGPHRILEHRRFLVPKDVILLNTEQFSDPPQPWQRRYADVIREFEVWDFSPRNIAILEQLGVRDVKLLELGSAGSLPTREPQPKDFDVVFYGAINPRRREILNSLHSAGVPVMCLENVFGDELYDVIARASIVLNIHRVEPCSLEMLRMLDLLPHGQFVISERGSDSLLEDRFAEGVVFSSRESLPDVCKAYLPNPDECRRIGTRGRAAFESVDQVDVLNRLLSRTENERIEASQ